MAIDQNTGGVITLTEAKAYIQTYKERYPEEVRAFFIGSANVNQILDQENCIGVRIYNGYDKAESRLNLIMVGVDKFEKDMPNIIMDRMLSCPTHCDPTSPLMAPTE
jgi:hypothetical protein